MTTDERLRELEREVVASPSSDAWARLAHELRRAERAAEAEAAAIEALSLDGSAPVRDLVSCTAQGRALGSLGELSVVDNAPPEDNPLVSLRSVGRGSVIYGSRGDVVAVSLFSGATDWSFPIDSKKRLEIIGATPFGLLIRESGVRPRTLRFLDPRTGELGAARVHDQDDELKLLDERTLVGVDSSGPMWEEGEPRPPRPPMRVTILDLEDPGSPPVKRLELTGTEDGALWHMIGGGRLVLASSPPDGPEQVIALDRTGGELWRIEAELDPVGVVDGRGLVVEENALSRLDLDTGRIEPGCDLPAFSLRWRVACTTADTIVLNGRRDVFAIDRTTLAPLWTKRRADLDIDGPVSFGATLETGVIVSERMPTYSLPFTEVRTFDPRSGSILSQRSTPPHWHGLGVVCGRVLCWQRGFPIGTVSSERS